MNRLLNRASLVLVLTAAWTALAADAALAQAAARKARRDLRKGETYAAKVPADLKVVKNIVFKQVGDTKLDLSPRHSLFLCEHAKEKGASAECLIVKGAGHGLRGEAIDPPAAVINQRTVDFFMANLTRP